MATDEREDDRRRRGLFFLLLVLSLLLLMLGLLLGYLAFGPESAQGSGRAGSRPVVQASRGPVVVDGSGQAVARPSTSSTTATGSGTAVTNAGPLVVTTSQVVGNVGPSSPATLVVTLSNPGPGDLAVTGVTARVTAVQGTVAPGSPACSASWYRVARFTGQRVVAAGTQTTVELTITFDDLPDVNQDSCKGATYSYAYRAEAELA